MSDFLSTIDAWYASRGWRPFPFQREVWEAAERGESGLLHAPTGTGKTLAVWLAAVARAAASGVAPAASRGLRVVWITPLKALAADTARALAEPLAALGVDWQVGLRTGDTSAAARRKLRERLPETLVTTPETLSILLSLETAHEMFAELDMVVVDEWHELLSTKRGVQAELALARLRSIAPNIVSWGLSATLDNLDEAAAALVGPGRSAAARLVKADVDRTLVVETLIPEPMERFPWAGHMGMRLLPQVIATIERAATTLVFTNTRSQAERWYEAIAKARPDWRKAVALHHGSIDRELREAAEDGLRRGTLRCVVATSSLDLGVDFGPVEQVVQVGSPKGIARLLQRAGRSGHRPGAVGRLVCVPTHALELVECGAARRAIADGTLEARRPLTGALDVLAQHIVTVACSGGFREEELFAEVRSTAAYRDLDERSWKWAMDFAARGGPALGAYPDYARIRERFGRWYVAGEKIARRHRMTIGTIVSDAAVEVKWTSGGRLGTVEESFVSRLKPGEKFLFAGRPLSLFRFDGLTAWVKRAGRGPVGLQVPRWNGGRMPLSTLLASAVETIVADAGEPAGRSGRGSRGRSRGSDRRDASPELEAVRPLLATQAAWSELPSPERLLVEVVSLKDGVHAFVFPFEGRLAHEGLAAVVAWRIAQSSPCTLTFAVNDWGFEISGRSGLDGATHESFWRRVLSPVNLLEDLLACVNGTEMAKRHFKEVARVAGLVSDGGKGASRRVSSRNLQASAGLIFDVLAEHDPGNMLLAQARREVLEQQFEFQRLAAAVDRMLGRELAVVEPGRLTPLAFPIWAEQIQNRFTSQGWLERITEMAAELEAAAGGRGRPRDDSVARS